MREMLPGEYYIKRIDKTMWHRARSDYVGGKCGAFMYYGSPRLGSTENSLTDPTSGHFCLKCWKE